MFPIFLLKLYLLLLEDCVVLEHLDVIHVGLIFWDVDRVVGARGHRPKHWSELSTLSNIPSDIRSKPILLGERISSLEQHLLIGEQGFLICNRLVFLSSITIGSSSWLWLLSLVEETLRRHVDSLGYTRVFAINGHANSVILWCDQSAFSVDCLILGQAVLNLLISWVYECLSKTSMIKCPTLRRVASLLRELSMFHRVCSRTGLLRAKAHRGWTAELIWHFCCVVSVV